MKIVFLDTNVFIDYLAQREGFYENAEHVIALCVRRHYKVLVSALSFATASYILSAHHKMSPGDIRSLFANFVAHGVITPVDTQTVNESLKSGFMNFEDAMQYYSALRENACVIITRNADDFVQSAIPVYTPIEFLEKVSIDNKTKLQ